MHGLIVTELKMFVKSQLGAETWSPDDNFTKIVATAAERAALTPNALLESFGQFIAPRLLSMYPALVKPEWRSLDVIEHTERSIHTVVRAQNPEATPPYLRVHRTSPSEVIIFYDSPRRLCSVAKGIISGLARHFGETLRITEERCMLAQDPDCTLVVSAGLTGFQTCVLYCEGASGVDRRNSMILMIDVYGPVLGLVGHHYDHPSNRPCRPPLPQACR